MVTRTAQLFRSIWLLVKAIVPLPVIIYVAKISTVIGTSKTVYNFVYVLAS